jgi:hypothetical protein
MADYYTKTQIDTAGYLTATAASTTYLTKTQTDGFYYTKTDADATFVKNTEIAAINTTLNTLDGEVGTNAAAIDALKTTVGSSDDDGSGLVKKAKDNASAIAALQGQMEALTGSSSYTADRVLVTNSAGKIAASSAISVTELGWLDGVTSGIQTQLNTLSARIDSAGSAITGAASSIATADLSTSMALVSNSAGKVAASSSVSATELGYLDNVTGNLQTQLDGKLSKPASGTAGFIKVNTDGTLAAVDTNAYALSSALTTLDAVAVKTTGTQTIAGTKTFSSMPVLPAQSPNQVLAGPAAGDSSGEPAFRALTAADIPALDASKLESGTIAAARIPTLNQDTTGSAAKLTTARSLKVSLGSTTAVTFDGSADQNAIPVTGVLPVANGGTGADTATRNYVFAAPSANNGTPSFRALTAADIPSLPASKITSGVSDSTSAEALSDTSTNLVTERDVYYGLASINNARQKSNVSIYAPTTAGTAGQFLKSNGGTSAPTWDSIPPLISDKLASGDNQMTYWKYGRVAGVTGHAKVTTAGAWVEILSLGSSYTPANSQIAYSFAGYLDTTTAARFAEIRVTGGSVQLWASATGLFDVNITWLCAS